MDIPLELERRFERRWAARFSSRIVSGVAPKDCVNRLPHPKAAAGLCPPSRTGEAVPVSLTWGALRTVRQPKE
jgi:hypothetical protein